MIGVIIQARLGSSRFPRKILEDISGKSCLEWVCHNVSAAKFPHRVILAMPKKDEEDLQRAIMGKDLFTDPPLRQMGEVVKRLKIDGVYFGEEDNVLSRYYEVAQHYGLDTIVRVTADCPLIRPDVIDRMLFYYSKRPHIQDTVVQNISRDHVPGEPRHISGFDVQIFKWWMLADAYVNAKKDCDLEHVMPYMFEKFGTYNVTEYCKMEDMIDFKGFDKLSFDTPEDLENIKRYMNNG